MTIDMEMTTLMLSHHPLCFPSEALSTVSCVIFSLSIILYFASHFYLQSSPLLFKKKSKSVDAIPDYFSQFPPDLGTFLLTQAYINIYSIFTVLY